MKDFKFAELCRFVTMTDTVIYPFAVVMNMDSWNALPADVKKVMEDLGTEQAEWTGTYMDNHVKDSIEWSKKNYNVEFIQLGDSEMAMWNQKLQFIADNWIKNAKEKGLAAEAIVEDIKTLTKKHSK